MVKAIGKTEIISFYEFKNMESVGELQQLKASLKSAMIDHDVRGTIILAAEGYNGMVCGESSDIVRFRASIEDTLRSKLTVKSSFADVAPFRKTDVRIKPEIVTLKKEVDISLGAGTHVAPAEWNKIISDPETLVLDARNDYEYQTGTFRGAINPNTKKFSELPDFVDANLDTSTHKRVAMFCTGGIRCEKFAPYMRSLGFEEIFQLEGGILKYIEETPVDRSLWKGECFVFDERITVDSELNKGSTPDLSQRRAASRAAAGESE